MNHIKQEKFELTDEEIKVALAEFCQKRIKLSLEPTVGYFVSIQRDQYDGFSATVTFSQKNT